MKRSTVILVGALFGAGLGIVAYLKRKEIKNLSCKLAKRIKKTSDEDMPEEEETPEAKVEEVVHQGPTEE